LWAVGAVFILARMTEERIGRRLHLTGRVQGVGFRAWLVDVAIAEGVDGWVRNRRDGSVEAVVAGPSPAVERVIAKAGNGPPMSRVQRVDQEASDEVVGPGFEAAPTV